MAVRPEVRGGTTAEPVQGGELQDGVGGGILVSPVEEFLADPGKKGDGVAIQHEANGAGPRGMLHGVCRTSRPPFFAVFEALLLDVGELALVCAPIGWRNHTEIHWRGVSTGGRLKCTKRTHGGQLCKPRARHP